MKKRIAIIASVCLVLAALSVLLISCGGNKDDSEAPAPTEAVQESSTEHTHSWGEWVIVEQPTCLLQGLAERQCSCGEKETKTQAKLDHYSDTWVIDKEPTLRERGRKHQVCSFCKIPFNTKNISKLGVTFLPAITDVYQDPYRPNYELADCRHLEGKPVVVLLFIDDDESNWTGEEVSAFTQKQVIPALDYLEENAKKWDVELDFVVESYSTALSGYEIKYEGTVNPNLSNGGSTKDVLDKAAEDIGCKSNWGIYSYYKSKHPNDDIIFLNLLNKDGRSYTRHAISTGYSKYAEHSVIFADYLGGSPDNLIDGERSSTIAHEILHLFGAEDYYTSLERELLAKEKYPNDIMLWQSYDIEDNLIGDCTAFSIGWTDTVPEVCYNDKWWS